MKIKFSLSSKLVFVIVFLTLIGNASWAGCFDCFSCWDSTEEVYPLKGTSYSDFNPSYRCRVGAEFCDYTKYQKFVDIDNDYLRSIKLKSGDLDEIVKFRGQKMSRRDAQDMWENLVHDSRNAINKLKEKRKEEEKWKDLDEGSALWKGYSLKYWQQNIGGIEYEVLKKLKQADERKKQREAKSRVDHENAKKEREKRELAETIRDAVRKGINDSRPY